MHHPMLSFYEATNDEEFSLSWMAQREDEMKVEQNVARGDREECWGRWRREQSRSSERCRNEQMSRRAYFWWEVAEEDLDLESGKIARHMEEEAVAETRRRELGWEIVSGRVNKGQGRVEGDTQHAYVWHAGWEERALDLEEHRRWKEAIGTVVWKMEKVREVACCVGQFRELGRSCMR